MLIFKLAALSFVTALLSLSLKKEQPAYAFLVSLGGASAVLVVLVKQIEPVLEWLRTLETMVPGQSVTCLLRVLGIALVSQLAADICREGGMSAAATGTELCGRILALLQALPLLQELLASYAGYLQ